MSENFKTVVKKLNEDKDLRDRVMNASSNDERKQIMQSAGLPVPTKEEIMNSQSLADVAGAGSTLTYVTTGIKIAGAFA
jgi:hypothetical protein